MICLRTEPIISSVVQCLSFDKVQRWYRYLFFKCFVWKCLKKIKINPRKQTYCNSWETNACSHGVKQSCRNAEQHFDSPQTQLAVCMIPVMMTRHGKMYKILTTTISKWRIRADSWTLDRDFIRSSPGPAPTYIRPFHGPFGAEQSNRGRGVRKGSFLTNVKIKKWSWKKWKKTSVYGQRRSTTLSRVRLTSDGRGERKTRRRRVRREVARFDKWIGAWVTSEKKRQVISNNYFTCNHYLINITHRIKQAQHKPSKRFASDVWFVHHSTAAWRRGWRRATRSSWEGEERAAACVLPFAFCSYRALHQ